MLNTSLEELDPLEWKGSAVSSWDCVTRCNCASETSVSTFIAIVPEVLLPKWHPENGRGHLDSALHTLPSSSFLTATNCNKEVTAAPLGP